MLQSLSRNALSQRPLARPLSHSLVILPRRHHPRVVFKLTLVHARLLSTPDSSTENHSSQNPSDLPPSALQQRKQKVGLRPGPVKPPPPRPSTLPTHHVPLHPNTSLHKPPPPSQASPPLTDVKETTKRDIEQAEAHGILTPPPPDANWFKRTVHKGIQLAKFYFRGVKLIFIRRREIAEIRARIKAGGAPLTRAEFRFIQTQKDDVNKVIPFIIIALLLEEVIPLIAIYAPSFLPSTCILPSQQERIREKKSQKALGFALNYSPLFLELKSKESPEGSLSVEAIRYKDAPTAVCGLLGLSTIGLDALRLRRIQHRLNFLDEDDRLLLRDGPQLSEKELTEALEERGLVGRHISSLKSKEAKLRSWLNSIQTSDPANIHARRLSLMLRNLTE